MGLDDDVIPFCLCVLNDAFSPVDVSDDCALRQVVHSAEAWPIPEHTQIQTWNSMGAKISTAMIGSRITGLALLYPCRQGIV